MGSFGDAFTTGSSSGPLTVSIPQNKNTRLVLKTLGTNTNEVGFVIKAENGSVIYQRSSGTAFIASSELTSFCVGSSCPILTTSPAQFDWRGYDRITPVKDQGSSCKAGWAFAATALYESILAISTRGKLYDLAEQYGLKCTIYSDC